MSVALLERAAAELGPLVDEVVFIGAAVLPLLLTDPAAPVPRATVDVDLALAVRTRRELRAFERRLESAGFAPDAASGVICRWRGASGLVVDAIPAEPSVLGFGSPWLAAAVAAPDPRRLPGGATIRVISAVLFLAAKLDAFADRGAGDHLGSRDFADAVALIDGRPQLVEEVSGAEPALRSHLALHARALLADADARQGLHGALAPDAASQARVDRVIVPALERVAASAP